jgi:dolichyl-phosphate-mannose-protein mannosyltransferase
VPNVSFSAYKLNFLQRFLEAHAVMFSGNAGLKPKDGELTSRPWMWPINLRVSWVRIINIRLWLFIIWTERFVGSIFLSWWRSQNLSLG